MTGRENIVATITHHKPDRVPYEVSFTVDMHEAMKAYTGSVEYTQQYIEPMLVRACLHQSGTYPKPGFYRDAFGVIWNRSVDKSVGVVENKQVTPETLDSYEFPQPLPDEHIAECRRVLETTKDLFRVGWLSFSFWERAWTLRGLENLYMDIASDPGFVHELLTRICDHNCRVLARAIKYLDVDAFHFGDDWGTQTGLQISPQMWRTFIKPYIKRMYAMARDAGKFVSIHSCGRVQELFDEIIEIGVNCFNPFQPEVIDVDWATAKYRNRLCFWGGLSTQISLPFGTPRQVYEETSHLIDLGRQGGMIVSPAHSIPPGAKPQNVIAMLEAIRDKAPNY